MKEMAHMKLPSLPTLGRMAANIVASALVLSSMSWATEASCSTTTALSNIGTGTGNGCYTVDQTYSNFTVTDQSSGAPTQSTSTVSIAGSSTWTSDATPWTNTITFSGNTGAGSNTAAPWSVTGSASSFEDLQAFPFYVTNSTESASYFPPPGYPVPPAGDSLLITSVSLNAVGSTGANTADGIYAGLEFCIGPAACGGYSGSGNVIYLLAEFLGAGVTTPTYICMAGTSASAACSAASSSSPITVTFSSPIPTLNFGDNYDLFAASGTPSTVTLTDFSINYGNEELTPEPSTFTLLGAALAVASVFERRKRKRDCRGNERHPWQVKSDDLRRSQKCDTRWD
jgi:hypothetical protein